MIKDTLYAKYIKERNGADLIESDLGFITYKVVEKECFLANIFVNKESRGSGECRKLVEKLYQIAKKSSCEFISANIEVSDPNAAITLSAAFKLGFKLVRAEHGILAIVKEVRGGIHG